MITIKKITWEQTRDMWEMHMPNMSIEPTSAMTCPKGLAIDDSSDDYKLIENAIPNLQKIPS